MNSKPTSLSGDEEFNMVKKFKIFSRAALAASFCLFAQGAGATALQSEADALAPAAGAGAMIRLAAQRVIKKGAKRTSHDSIRRPRRTTNFKKPTTKHSPVNALTDAKNTRIIIRFSHETN